MGVATGKYNADGSGDALLDKDMAAQVGAATSKTRTALNAAFAGKPIAGQALGGSKTVINRSNGTADCIGVDQQNATGAIWFADRTNGVLVQSDDANATQGNKPWPTNVTSASATRIVRFAGLVLLLATDTVDGKVKVWSAPYQPQATNFTWSAPLLTLTTGSMAFAPSLEVSNWGHDERIIVTEYGDPTGGPSAYISSDGATFTKRFGPDATMRHIHHAAFDPYNAGHIWMTCGDGIAKTIMRSTDYGLTWTTAVASSDYQAVQISFTPNWVYLAGDSRTGSALVLDRATATPRWAATNHHHDIPVPRPRTGPRTLTTLAITAGSTAITSTGEFTADDQGRYLTAVNGNFLPDTYISAVTPPNSATISRAALATASGSTGYLSGDMYLNNAYYGAVDPATGVYYCVANDTSNAGKFQGMFYLDRLGGRFEILDPGAADMNLNQIVFVYRGHVWSGQWSRPLLSLGTSY